MAVLTFERVGESVLIQIKAIEQCFPGGAVSQAMQGGLIFLSLRIGHLKVQVFIL